MGRSVERLLMVLVMLLAVAVGAWFYLSRGAKPMPQETPVAQAPPSAPLALAPETASEFVPQAAPAIPNPPQDSDAAPQPGSIYGMFQDKDTGEGVAGVQIEAYRWKPRRGDGNNATMGLVKAGDTVSVAKGQFEISGLEPGSYLLARPETPGYQPERPEDRIRVGVRSGERLDGLVFELVHGVVISGRVIDTQGAAIEGAEVHLWQRNGEPRTAFTDARGEFTFEGAEAGRLCTIEAVALGFSSSRKNSHDDERLRTVGIDGVSGIEIVLGPGRSFEGVLVNETGQPIPDARLHADNVFWASNVLTKADGTFLCIGLPESTTETKVRGSVGEKPLKFLDGTETIRLGSGLHTKGVRLVAQPTAYDPLREERNLHPPANMTTGRIVDPEGQPLNDIEVSVFDPSGAPLHHRMASFTVSGPDGKFALEIEKEGEATLCVVGQGVVSDRFEGIRSGSKENVLKVRYSLSIAGIVRDAATGGPVKQFRVIVTRPGIEFSPTRSLSALPNSPETVYAPDGRFTVYSNMPDAVGVNVMAPGYGPAQQDVRFDQAGAYEPVEFSLQPERVVTGIVVDSDGVPIGLARVGAGISEHAGGYAAAHGMTGDDGRFVLGGLESSQYGIIVSARGFARTGTEVDLTTMTKADLRFVLEKTGVIEGQVVRDGEPVPEIFVNAKLLESATSGLESYGRTDWDTITDPNGRYRMEEMPAGRYELICNVFGIVRSADFERREARVESGKVAEVNFP